VAEGYGALFNNVSGSDNTASGGNALFANISGNNNEAYGYGSLGSLTNGSDNSAYGSESLYTLKNGNANVAVGDSSLESIPSGNDNTAVGYYAFLGLTNGSSNIALGYDAGFYLHQGSGDIYIGNDAATTNSETNIIRIGEAQTKTYLVGTVYANTVALTSDRNAKENFTAINVSDILAKIAALPVTRWNYKTDSHAEQHIGPMAQDFQAAFQLSADDKHISVVDEGGVALAAIQGLNRKLDQKDAEIQALKQQNDSLATRLASLEQTVQALAANPKTANAEP
jgi:Chaperone of endosialidase